MQAESSVARRGEVEPRYEVVSIRGDALPKMGSGQTVWIADRLNCFREVWIKRRIGAVHWPLDLRTAARRCAELNAEHEAWMAENGYAASEGVVK